MGLALGPLFGFIAFSQILYQKIFGLSEVAFALLFGVNAIAAMVWGRPLCSALGKNLRVLASDCQLRRDCRSSKSESSQSAVSTPTASATLMAIISACIGMSRPLCNHLVLEQVTQDIGAGVVLPRLLPGHGRRGLHVACLPALDGTHHGRSESWSWPFRS